MNDFVDRLMPLLWTQTWQVAAVVAAITLVTRLQPVRRRPHLAYALWLLVLAKCLTPPLFSSPTSPFSWALASTATPIVNAAPAPIADFDPPQVATSPDPAPQFVPQRAERPLVESGDQWIETSSRGELPAAALAIPTSTQKADPVLTPRGWLALAWLIGGTLYFTMAIGRYIRTRHRLIRSGLADTARLDDSIREITRLLRLRRSPRAIVTPEPFGPAVLGLLRPVLVVPESAAASLSLERLKQVLAHEMVHLRRGDHWMGLVQFILQALWWFNPLVWWANREINRVREQCCDEEVLATLRCEPAGYAQTLLDIARLGAQSRPLVLTAGVSAMHVTGQRLRHIMSDAGRFRRKTPRFYWLLAGLAAALLLPGAGMALDQNAAPTNSDKVVEKSSPKKSANDQRLVGDSSQNRSEGTTGSKQTPLDSKAPNDTTASQPVKQYPIAISGHAFDRTRKPIKDATVYLVAFHVGSAEYKPPTVIAQTTTGADGKYLFRRAQLPVTVPDDTRRNEVGSFQVLGKAPGHAFAWHGPYSYYTDARYANVEAPKVHPEGLKSGYYPGQPIDLDLTFGPAKTINGRFVDEAGKPIEGVKVRLNSCFYIDTAGRERSAQEFRYIDTAGPVAMPDQVQVISDSEGRFAFSSIPADVVCWLFVEHPQYGFLALHSTTAQDPPATRNGEPVVKPPIELTLRSAKTIVVQVQPNDQGKSTKGTLVQALEKLGGRNAAYGHADASGKITLKLPRGEYRLIGYPPAETGDVKTEQDLVVAEVPAEQSVTLKLDPGTVLLFKALDAETGKGIPGVSFWHATVEKPSEHTQVHSIPGNIDNPTTGENGELRVVVFPGTRLYGVHSVPMPPYRYEQYMLEGRKLELPAGKTVTAEFKFQKLPAKLKPRGVKGSKATQSEKAKKQAAIKPSDQSRQPTSAGQQAPGSGNSDSPINFTGAVIDRSTKKPLAGVKVLVHQTIVKQHLQNDVIVSEHRTDEKGTYQFTLAPKAKDDKRSFIIATLADPKFVAVAPQAINQREEEEREKAGVPRFIKTIEAIPGDPISGTVEGPDGKPVTGAKVEISYRAIGNDRTLPTGGSETKTDSAGRFTATVARGALVNVLVHPAQLVSRLVKVGDKRGDIGRIQLAEGVQLPGRVLDDQGNPVAGAWVSILKPLTDESFEEQRINADLDGDNQTLIVSMPFRSVRTDQNGRFRIHGIVPGDYWLTVSDRPSRVADAREAPAVLPCAFDRTTVSVRKVESPEDVVIRGVPSITVEMRFVDSAGRPARAIEGALLGEFRGVPYAIFLRTAENGTAAARVPKGSKGLQIQFLDPDARISQFRLEKDEPLRNISGNEIDLGNPTADMLGIEVARGSAGER